MLRGYMFSSVLWYRYTDENILVNKFYRFCVQFTCGANIELKNILLQMIYCL